MINVFLSYATKDKDVFQIARISKKLESYNDINEVLYWEEDSGSNIIKFMNDSINKYDVMLLFCSPNSLKSEWVEKEWTAAIIHFSLTETDYHWQYRVRD